MKIEEKYTKVGERGQIVIPKSIREKYGIKPKQMLRIVEMPGEIMIRKPVTEEPEKRFFELLTKTGLSSKYWKRIHKEREER